MAFGYGPGADMMKSFKANRKQLKKNKPHEVRSRTQKENSQDNNPKEKKLSLQGMEEFKMELEREREKERFKTRAIIGIIVVVVVLGIYLLMFN